MKQHLVYVGFQQVIENNPEILAELNTLKEHYNVAVIVTSSFNPKYLKQTLEEMGVEQYVDVVSGAGQTNNTSEPGIVSTKLSKSNPEYYKTGELVCKSGKVIQADAENSVLIDYLAQNIRSIANAGGKSIQYVSELAQKDPLVSAGYITHQVRSHLSNG